MKYKLNNFYNEDCLEAMKQIPDNYFDLAIVDPPYGINIDGQKEYKSKNNNKHNRKYHKQKDWDKSTPEKEYFEELYRVSKNQIIWGANYFVDKLNKNTKGWVVWDKAQYGLTMSDCELAFSSFDKPTRVFKKNRSILRREGDTIHPTQKPVELYLWLLNNYAKKGDKILDTHVGSASSLIACHELGYDFIGFELDEDYYKEASARLERSRNQLKLF